MKPHRSHWTTHPLAIPLVGICLPAFLVSLVGLAAVAGAWQAGGPGQALPLALQFCATPAVLGAFALPVVAALGLALLIRWGTLPGQGPSAEQPMLWFEGLDWPHPRVPLTRQQLRKFLLITGRPGSGKTTLAGALLASMLREAAAQGRADGQRMHTVVFDVHRSLAAPIAALSRELGRRPVVIDLGHPEAALGLVLPRPGPNGVEALVESVRRSWFSFQGEVPTQMRDTLKNAFALLDAGGYGLEQALRVLLSPRFRDHLLAQNPGRLPPHLPDWLTLIGSMPPGEQRNKFLSTFARLFMLLESPALRLTLAGRGHGGFDLETLVDPDYAGPGIDLIITAQGHVPGELIYFFFGLVLNELSAVLRLRLSGSRASRAPDVAVFIDEMGRYGSPEAMLEFVAASRNVGVTVAGIVHSVALLDPHLEQQVLVSATNRVAGGEVGPGAEATAAQLFAYMPEMQAASDGAGRAAWSATDEMAAFLSRLRHLPDRELVVRFDGWRQALWARPLLGYGRRPLDARLAAGLSTLVGPQGGLGAWLARVADSGGPAAPLLPDLPAEAMEAALEQTAVGSGRPVAELEAELRAENAALDRLCGAVAYEPVVRAAAGDERWRTRADDDFAPY